MPPALERLWRTVAVDEVQVDALVLQRSLPRPLARVLVGRGLSDAETAERHLNPRLSELGDPFLLPAMAPAVERLWQAIRACEPVVVFGDYDVDGITATCLVTDWLRSVGLDAVPYIPDRIEEGYGLNNSAIDSLREAGVTLIVTVD